MVAAAVPSYQWLRDYAKAMQYHTQALAMAKEVGDGVVSCLYGSLCYWV